MLLFSSWLPNRKRSPSAARRRSAIALGAAGAALALTICISFVRAGEPPTIQAYANGKIVNVLVDTNVSPEDEVIASGIANPLYLIDEQDISHVLSIPTGAPNGGTYNPYWMIIPVIITGDVTLPLTSGDAVLSAVNAGHATLDYDGAFYVLCPEISK
ncbi:MAG TPA: hypothetical protein VNH11_05235 [Pirellulales bacterium]|nr:hypothetical protein [Pirellulales bacterium]